MAKFVIRSMSTTDFTLPYRSGGKIVPGQKSTPYHIYLMRPEKRVGAWWSTSPIDRQVFETEAEAQEVFDKLFGNHVWYSQPQVCPIDATDTFWDYQDVRSAQHYYDKGVEDHRLGKARDDSGLWEGKFLTNWTRGWDHAQEAKEAKTPEEAR